MIIYLGRGGLLKINNLTKEMIESINLLVLLLLLLLIYITKNIIIML